MVLSGEEREMLIEARDLAQSTNQTLHEVIVPALKGDGKSNPGLEARVNDLEELHAQLRGSYKTLAIIGAVAVGLATIVGAVILF